MNKASVYHRTSEQYCYMLDHETVKINIKVGYEVKSIQIVNGDPFSGGILGGNWAWDGQTNNMELSYELEYHKVFTIELKPRFKRLKYYFIIKTDDSEICYTEQGFYTKEQLKANPSIGMFVYPWMNEIDVNITPKWAAKTIWYQVFVDRFKNGNKAIDLENVKKWHSGKVTNEENYGGDLYGLYEKLDYIKSLGINGIYLNPIFKSYTNHKYDTNDYYEIDPQFGDKEIFKKVVDKAHELGMKVMLDAVFNHCGRDFEMWKDVVEKREKSKYYDWFIINDLSSFDPNVDPHNGEFYTFAFTRQMPKLNTSNLEVQQYLIDVATYWAKEFNIDGWRLDVANEVSHNFNKKLRTALKEINSEFYILGEIWHDSINWLLGDEFDAVMNYPLTNAITEFFDFEENTTTNLMHKINKCYMMYQQQTNEVNFNLLDSHDTARLRFRTKNYDQYIQQLVMLLTMQGSTCIYYGTEVYMDGAHDPDCRRLMPWDKIENKELEKELNDFKQLVKIRNDYDATYKGLTTFTKNINDERVVEYKKEAYDYDLQIYLNSSKEQQHLEINGEILFSNKLSDNLLLPDGAVVIKVRKGAKDE